MLPVLDSYGGIPGYVIFWILFAIALGFFVQRAVLLVRLLKLGRAENRFNHLAYRMVSMLAVALTQSSNLKTFSIGDSASLGHSVMYWGFLIFGIAYLIFIGLGAGFGLNTIF